MQPRPYCRRGTLVSDHRRIPNKLFIDHPSAPLNLIIDYANLAMSHTVGPEGFTPAILSFGAQPSLPIGQYDETP